LNKDAYLRVLSSSELNASSNQLPNHPDSVSVREANEVINQALFTAAQNQLSDDNIISSTGINSVNERSSISESSHISSSSKNSGSDRRNTSSDEQSKSDIEEIKVDGPTLAAYQQVL